MIVDSNTIRVNVVGNTRTLRVVVANATTLSLVTASDLTVAYNSSDIVLNCSKVDIKGTLIDITDVGGGTASVTVGSRFTYFANSLDNPVNADYPVNALAPITTDPVYNSISVRSFSNTVEQGVGCVVSVPIATTMILKLKGRANTAPASAASLQFNLYIRQLPHNTPVGAWSSAYQTSVFSVPTNTYIQYYTYTVPLASIGLITNNLYQFEFTRKNNVISGTNLS